MTLPPLLGVTAYLTAVQQKGLKIRAQLAPFKPEARAWNSLLDQDKLYQEHNAFCSASLPTQCFCRSATSSSLHEINFSKSWLQRAKILKKTCSKPIN